MFATLLQVAIGGAIGSAARHALGVAVLRATGPGFPLSILTVNVLGSLAMGAFAALAAQRGLTHLSPLVLTGLLGGFTTFSAFSLETVAMLERGEAGQAAVYVLASVGASVGALYLGLYIVRALA